MIHEGLAERLSALKFQLTPARAEVVGILQAASTPISHDTIMARLAADADRVTVYRIVNRLVELGVARKFEGDDKKSYFELSQPATHAHFLCKQCQMISCLENIHLDLPTGYMIEEITIRGLCPGCGGISRP